MSELERSRAAEIRRLHIEICGELQSTVDKAIHVGELLAEQKESMAHGDWLPWIEANCGFSVRVAQEYMRMYEHRAELKSASLAHLADARLMLVAEDDQPDEFSVLWRRQDFVIPGSSISVSWNGPEIRTKAKDDPHVVIEEYKKLLSVFAAVILAGDDLRLLESLQHVVFSFAQDIMGINLELEAKVGGMVSS